MTAKTDQTTQLSVTQFGTYKPAEWSLQDPRQKDCETALLQFIAEDLQPLSVVEAPSFRSFSKKLNPNFHIPSRKTISTKLLPDLKRRTRASLRCSLSQASAVSLTVDIWTSRDMRSYLGVTAHYVQDFQLKKAMLSCIRFRGSHTAENIAEQYDSLIEEYDLRGKVLTIITDNAANMLKAFRLPGMETGNEEDPDADLPDSSETSDDLDPELLALLPRHHSCFIHTLQLVIKDGLKKSPGIQKVISKCAVLVKKVRHSALVSELLENDKKLVMSCATRWNTQLAMLRSVLQLPEDSLEKLDSDIRPSRYELKMMQEVLEILSPFETATKDTEGDNIVTASFVVIAIRGLRQQLEELYAKYSSNFIANLQESLDRRLSKYETITAFTHAAALDPRWKLSWTTKEERQQLTESLAKSVSSLLPQSTQTGSTDSPPAKKKRLYSFLDRQISASSSSTTAQQVQQYLSEPCLDDDAEPLLYWKSKQAEYPQLADMASKYLSTPASSAPVERIFSIAGKIFRPERCNLCDTRFQD